MIDLRSDTITRPTDAMRRAMADAPVGDDVYHDDPTVNRLEERVAELLGKDAAVYVPTGTMSNQIAVRFHTEPGDTILTSTDAHIAIHEIGAPAALSGVTIHELPGADGTFTSAQVRAAVPQPSPSLPYWLFPPVTLLAAENTHNAAGGTIWPLERLVEVANTAHALGLATHLDGARLWNATAATGIPEADYARVFDTTSVCFSKGLGAPVGSALVGDRDVIDATRRFKQMYGGGMRQAGIVAAGALYALDHHRERLVEDHDHARRFAEALADLPGVEVDLDRVQTNMVYFTVADGEGFAARCRRDGLDMIALGPTQIRAVFHLGVSDADTDRAIDIVRRVASPPADGS